MRPNCSSPLLTVRIPELSGRIEIFGGTIWEITFNLPSAKSSPLLITEETLSPHLPHRSVQAFLFLPQSGSAYGIGDLEAGSGRCPGHLHTGTSNPLFNIAC